MNFETLMKLSQIASESELQDNSLALADKATVKPQQIDFRDGFIPSRREILINFQVAILTKKLLVFG